MTQHHFPIQYQFEKFESGMTSFAGLPLYLELAQMAGLPDAIHRHLSLKHQGWTDQEIIMALVLLNIAGGDCVDDIERLNQDKGLALILSRIATFRMSRRQRRTYERRWRKEKDRSFPSASSIHRFLMHFHNDSEEEKRSCGHAFIPQPNESLQALSQLNNSLIGFAQTKRLKTIATLDQDATLVSTEKQTAFFCYENYRAYQPFNTYWHEQGMLLHSEFRDGNVNAGYEQLRLFKESLARLPEGVQKVLLRSDSAGYQHNLLRFCAEGQDPRWGVIEFAVSVPVRQGFKAAVRAVAKEDWHPVYVEDPEGHRIKTDQEWAEVCFVPNWTCTSKRDVTYRFIALREPMHQQLELPGIEKSTEDKEYPFPTINLHKKPYILFGLVTNRTIPGDELIAWHRKRMGESERVHSTQKRGLAGGHLPSSKFGANAAWWQIVVLAYNLNALMKNLCLPEDLAHRQLKALRFHLIGLAGRVIRHARRLVIKVSGKAGIQMLFLHIRRRLEQLAQGPPLLDSG